MRLEFETGWLSGLSAAEQRICTASTRTRLYCSQLAPPSNHESAKVFLIGISTGWHMTTTTQGGTSFAQHMSFCERLAHQIWPWLRQWIKHKQMRWYVLYHCMLRPAGGCLPPGLGRKA